MKKIILGALMTLSMVALSAQVMGSNGVKNTLWTGFGNPDSKNDDVRWYGITDTLQARVDVAQFTIEGMINWGFFTSFNGEARNLSYTEKTAFYAANKFSDAVSSAIDDAITDPYYVNFLWHPFAGLDLGAGTRLEWKVGPAPACSDYYWGKNAHIKQGGLKYAAPDARGLTNTTYVAGSTDVAGFVYYPNTYTSTIRGYTNPGSLGLRYTFDDIFEGGVAIPSGTTVDDFSFNIGLKLQPIDMFAVSFAYEGVCKDEGHLYAGLQLFLQKNFTLNGFFAMNNLGGNENVKNGVNGFGLSAVYGVRSMPLTVTPEFGMTFYENDDYSNAFYVGSGLDYAMNKQFTFGTWISFAWGSSNKNWEKFNCTKDFTGGSVFDIRPKLSMDINKNNNLTIYADYQSRTAYDNTQSSTWAAGVYWTYTK